MELEVGRGRGNLAGSAPRRHHPSERTERRNYPLRQPLRHIPPFQESHDWDLREALAEPREHWQLKNIERATKQKIEIGSVPTVADLRAKRMELTKASLRESLLAGGFDGYRVVVESLAEEFDPLDVAAAAVKMADPAAGSADSSDEHEIPAVAVAPPPAPRFGKGGKGKLRDKAAHGGRSGRIFIGAGRDDGLQPGDVVKAIVKRAKVHPREVGSIRIAERFSIVEVPDAITEDVIRALRAAGVRGNKVTVRRDRA